MKELILFWKVWETSCWKTF